MDIRPARMQDVPEIAAVHVGSWQAAYRGLLPQAYLDGLDPSQRIGQWERSVSADRSDGGTLVAEAAGRLSGFVSYVRLAMTTRIRSEPGRFTRSTWCPTPGMRESAGG
jgi:hypothetical protein